MNNMPGDYLSSKEVRHPNTSRTTENEKLLNEKQVRQKHDETKKPDQARRNEKNSGGGWGGEVPITKYCRPPWLADQENFSFQFKSSKTARKI